MSPRSIRLTLAAVVAALGCGGETDDRAMAVVATENDSAGVAIVTIQGSPSELPEWRVSTPIAEVSGDAEPFLGGVGEVRFLSDGRFLVEDSQSELLYLAEPDGGALKLIGDQGEGPGEFRDVTTLTVGPGDTTFVFDRRLLRVSVLGPDGALLSTVSVADEFPGAERIDGGWATDSRHFLIQAVTGRDTLATGDVWRDQRDALLFSLDELGRPRSPPIQFVGGYHLIVDDPVVGRPFIAVSPFANTPIVAVGDERVVHGSGLDYELSIRSPTLRLERVVRWPEARAVLDDATLEAAWVWADELFEPMRRTDRPLADAAVEGIFTPSILPDSLPTLSRVLMDADGRMWVSRFIPSSDAWNQADAWHVLSPTGVPLARLSLPAGSRLVAITEDRVALVERDALEVQHLRVLELESDVPR